MTSEEARATAIDIIAGTSCAGALGAVGRELAEAIMRRLEDGGLEIGPVQKAKAVVADVAPPRRHR